MAEELKDQEQPKSEEKKTEPAATSAPAPEEKPEPEVASLDTMTVEEIKAAEVPKKRGRPAKQQPPKEEPKPAAEKPEEKPKPEEKKDQRVPIGKDPEGNPLFYNDKGEIVTGDRLKDTQAALTKTQEMLKQANTELEQYKQQEQVNQFADFIVLENDELAELKQTDPEDAKAYEAELQQFNQYQAENQQRRAVAQWLTILDAAQEITGKGIDPNLPFQQQEAEVQRFLIEVVKNKIDPYVTENFRPDKNGIYTKDQIISAHKVLYQDHYSNKSKQEGREEALQDIQKAGSGGSSIDRIPRGQEGGGMKPLEQLTAAEINSLTPDEVEYYSKQLGK